MSVSIVKPKHSRVGIPGQSPVLDWPGSANSRKPAVWQDESLSPREEVEPKFNHVLVAAVFILVATVVNLLPLQTVGEKAIELAEASFVQVGNPAGLR